MEQSQSPNTTSITNITIKSTIKDTMTIMNLMGTTSTMSTTNPLIHPKSIFITLSRYHLQWWSIGIDPRRQSQNLHLSRHQKPNGMPHGKKSNFNYNK